MKLQTFTSKRTAELSLQSAEVLALIYLCLLSVCELIFGHNIKDTEYLALGNAVAGAALLFLLAASRKIQSPRLQSAVRFVAVMLLTSFIYNQMGRIIHLLFPFTMDQQINRIELALFGRYPTSWLESFASPALTEIMMFAYVIYVPLLLLLGLFFVLRGKNGDAERYAMEITITFLFCYLFYFLVPVAGPSRALAAVRTVPLQGYFFTSIAGYMISNVHLPGGAFPSAHCAATTVMLAALYRHRTSAGHLFLPLAMLIFVSTVYGWFHYVTDVIAGIGIACIMLYVSPRVQNALNSVVVRLRLPEIRFGVAGENTR